MRRIHKIAARILALTLCFCLMASTAMAAPYKWSAPKKGNKVQSSQSKQTAQSPKVNVLHDIKGHWAEAAMAKMNMKKVIYGYENATFQPNKNISRLETVVMLVRLIGAEDEALKATTIPATFKNANQIDDWARGYVAVAVQKGILTGDDLKNFRPNQSAQRYEIAVMSLRALGLADQAQSQNWRNLSFLDTSDVPEWARGYVCLIEKKNVMKGYPDRSFRPKQPITRAEMASMLERMESLLKNQFKAEEIKGTLQAVDVKGKEVTVKRTDGSTQTMEVAPEALIYNEKNAATTLNKLVVGSQVDILTNDEGTAVFIRAYKPEKVEVSDTDLIRGTIEDVDTGTLTINVGGAEITLAIAAGATVKLDGKSADVDDLQAGQTVEIKVSNKQIVAIAAETQEIDLSGTVVATGTNSIAVKVGNTVLVYSVAANAVIKRDGKTVKLSSLQSGDAVELEVRDGVALRITAAQGEDVDEEDEIPVTIIGMFVSATAGTITIEMANGNEKTYYVRADANIERNGYDADLNDLKAGDTVELELEDGVVVDIQAEAVEVDEAHGTFVSATAGAITIKLENGNERTYYVRAGANIERNGYDVDLDDLKAGDMVELELIGGVVVDIQAEAVNEAVGTVKAISTGTITIELAGGADKTYAIRADAKFIEDGDIIDFEDIKVGDEVELTLTDNLVTLIEVE